MSDKHDTDQFNSKAAAGGGNGAADPPAPSGYPALEFDPAEFMHFLNDADWSEDEKAEYITLVWNIVCEFVALGFDVHPFQQAQDSGGKPPAPRTEQRSISPDVIDSSHSDLVQEYVRLNGAEPGSGAEGVSDE